MWGAGELTLLHAHAYMYCTVRRWEEFKPVLQALPSSATLPQLRLPPFRAPILDTELPFIEPDYVPLPEVRSVTAQGGCTKTLSEWEAARTPHPPHSMPAWSFAGA